MRIEQGFDHRQIEGARPKRISVERLHNAPIEEIDQIVGSVIIEAHQKNPAAPVLQLYRDIACILPGKTSSETQQRVLDAARGEDQDIAQKGKRAFVFLNLKSILSAVEPYLSEDVDENDDMVQGAIVSVFANIDNIKIESGVGVQLHHIIRDGDATEQIATREHMRKRWVKGKRFKDVEKKVDSALETHPYGLDQDRISEVVEDLTGETDKWNTGLKEYVAYRMATAPQEEKPGEDETFKEVQKGLLRDSLDSAMNTLDERRSRIIQMRYGFDDGQKKTLDVVGKVLGITREGVRQIEVKAISILRNPHISNRLRDYSDE